MAKFRKKPVVIEPVQWKGYARDKVITEADAKEKWCPNMRGPQGSNMIGLPPDQKVVGACIGSACMAWRWIDDGDRVEVEHQDIRKLPSELNPPFSNLPEGFTVKSHDSGGFFYCERETSRLPPRGYCGQFGRPE